MLRMFLLTGLIVAPVIASAQSPLEVDHVFTVVTAGAPEAQVLQKAGFSLFPDTTTHEGQGTASVFFMFENAYFELIWIDNAEELRRADTELAARMMRPDTSPFGLGLRQVNYEAPGLPFHTRSYKADWIQPNAEVRFAKEGSLEEPLVFVVPAYMSWLSSAPLSFREQISHPNGAQRITSVHVSGPRTTTPSAALHYLLQQGVIETAEAPDHVLELEFDHGQAGKTFDARPVLPLLVRY